MQALPTELPLPALARLSRVGLAACRETPRAGWTVRSQVEWRMLQAEVQVLEAEHWLEVQVLGAEH